MKIYTIGFKGKKAKEFFDILKKHGIKRLIDVRLNNTSQLSGFAKKPDIEYFLKELCNIDYIHDPSLAPTENLLNDFKNKKVNWENYEKIFSKLMEERQIDRHLKLIDFNIPTVLLCSETKADYCHRRLIAEFIKEKLGNIEIINL